MGLGITGYHRVSPKGRPGGGQNGMTGYHRVSPGITTLTGYHRVSLGITTELGITGYHRVSHGLGVSTVTEFKPPIILTYSKMFVFARSRRLGRVTSSYLGMFWINTFPFTCKKLKVQKVDIIILNNKKLQT